MNTTFLELDHRLNHHAKKPHPECPVCQPDRITVTEEHTFLWDHSGLKPPPFFPQFGTIWNRGDETRIFVKVAPNRDRDDISGVWVNPSQIDLLSTKTNVPIGGANLAGLNEIQIEMGTGEWHSRVERVGITQRIPAELMDTSGPTPMGQDVVNLTIVQNRARLLRDLVERGIFPVGISETVTGRDHVRDHIMIVSEEIRAVVLPQTMLRKAVHTALI